jgi:5-oxoprolinase (ATP-hydrolysing) subunit A
VTIPRVDLNADVGESDGTWPVGHDRLLLPHVTSVNVACGLHACDPGGVRATVALAREYGVAVGAHPGFADRVGFGRREVRLTPREVEDLVVSQIQALAAVAAAQGVRLQHVKAHGALYNMAAREIPLADAVARATAHVDRSLILVGLSGSQLLTAGERIGLRTASEAFADRAYRFDGTLLPRSEPGAVINDVDVVVSRAVGMVRDRMVLAVDGTCVPLKVGTICVHGDTPGAPVLAASLRAALVAEGFDVRALG